MWVNKENPGETEIRYPADSYHFRPLTPDDCDSREQPPKREAYPDYPSFIFHGPFHDRETHEEYFVHGPGFPLSRISGRVTDPYFPAPEKILNLTEDADDHMFDEQAVYPAVRYRR